ncbi:MAG: zinc ribbon domain-containing protein [Methanomicrobium sp.]|nr:zinc ribbon domain-containing protein [Methanomicrobium sp.]
METRTAIDINYSLLKMLPDGRDGTGERQAHDALKMAIDALCIYNELSFIPVPKDVYEGMRLRLERKDEEIRRLRDLNKPTRPFENAPLDYPKQNKTYNCGQCGSRIRKGAKYCSECGRAVYWGE